MVYGLLCVKKVKVILLFLFILLMCSSVSGQVLIEDITVGIGKGVNITLSSDLEVSESVEWLNNGIVNIIPLNYSSIVFDAKEGSESLGKFIFAGKGDIFLSSMNTVIQMQNIQIERDIEVDNNLQIGKSLALMNGIVFLNNYSVLSIINSDESSILHKSNESYIEGSLKRSVKKDGGVYKFPIGSSYGNHNVKIGNISNSGEVCINYDDNDVFADNLLNTNTEVAINGFWHISTSDEAHGRKIRFTADFDFSAFSKRRSKKTVINELISKNYQDATGNWGIVPTKFDELHLSSLIDVSQADYSVIRREESEFVNTLVVNGRDESRFVIPIIKGISNGELTVVNNQGKVVYHSRNYNNDFDGASVQQGTYYYRFTYRDELSGKRKEKKGFIEIFYEK